VLSNEEARKRYDMYGKAGVGGGGGGGFGRGGGGGFGGGGGGNTHTFNFGGRSANDIFKAGLDTTFHITLFCNVKTRFIGESQSSQCNHSDTQE
jgi:DnaJ-class molecular chaperone